MTERWTTIKGYEGYYQISDHGRLKALPRRVRLGSGSRWMQESIQVANPLTTGYIRYQLCREGRKETAFAHRLVATYFIPNPDQLPQVNHKDGDKANNHWENLEWCDGSTNHQHAVATGLQKAARGEASGHSFKGNVLVYKDGVHIDTLCGAVDMRNKGYNPGAVYKVCLHSLPRS